PRSAPGSASASPGTHGSLKARKGTAGAAAAAALRRRRLSSRRARCRRSASGGLSHGTMRVLTAPARGDRAYSTSAASPASFASAREPVDVRRGVGDQPHVEYAGQQERAQDDQDEGV